MYNAMFAPRGFRAVKIRLL